MPPAGPAQLSDGVGWSDIDPKPSLLLAGLVAMVPLARSVAANSASVRSCNELCGRTSFTYTDAGGHADSEQRWYTLVGHGPFNHGGTPLVIHKSAPGVFATGPSVGTHVVGTATLSALGCNGLLFAYDFIDSEQEARHAAIPLTRVDSRNGCAATPSSNAAAAWYDPQAAGQGLLLTPTSAGPLAGGWFAFDAEAQANDESQLTWFTLVAEGADNSMAIYRTVGGSLDAEPTNNTWQVGRASFTQISCDHARFQYEFVDESIARGFRGRRGVVELTGATPPDCRPTLTTGGMA